MRSKNQLYILLLALLCGVTTTHGYPKIDSPWRQLNDLGFADGPYGDGDGEYRENWAGITVSPDCITLAPTAQNPPMEPTGPLTTTTTCYPPMESIPAPPTPPSTSTTVCEYPPQAATPPSEPLRPFWHQDNIDESEERRKEMRVMLQHIYVAQARVQLEATEIKKAQGVASSALAQLEETTNQVRTITASLHTAQQSVAAAAIRAQIAQLQVAAHNQLLFAARQDLDSLSSQMVGLQAAEGIVQPKLNVDLSALLDKLKQPLQQFDRPTPVPTILANLPALGFYPQQQKPQQQQQNQQQSVPQWQQQNGVGGGQVLSPGDAPTGGQAVDRSNRPVAFPNEMNEVPGQPNVDNSDKRWYDI
ncbi:bromodomain-containing protein [Drosophila madeirensis]|uniref:Bromodomain-containing protein n=1 Tax=Drosophila madeirensis TaxID=30013 RepID=A0AAU9FQ68_DROMD